MGGEKTLPRAIIGVWNKKNRCGIKRLPSEENSIIYLIFSQRPLGPKIWQQGPNYLKHDCLGPGESIDTHLVGFCEKIAIF